MTEDVASIAAKLTKAQREALHIVCMSNGGGVRIKCSVGDDGYGIPISRPVRALWEQDLVQGKSGAYDQIVHTRLGLKVRDHLLSQNSV